MNRLPVTSTLLKSIGYETINDVGVLEVEFKGGEVYRYSGVPQFKYDTLLDLNVKFESVGRYFNDYIKKEYRVERVAKTGDPDAIIVSTLKIEDDPVRQIVTIEGVPYAYGVFQLLANPDETKIYKFKKTDQGLVMIIDVTPHSVTSGIVQSTYHNESNRIN